MTFRHPHKTNNEDGNCGRVFNFTKYMLEDGPGIRTMVFFKGCPLRCLWCSSPLGQSRDESLLYLASKCVSCGTCVDACPEKALFVVGERQIARDLEKCMACGTCVQVCPTGAMTLCGTTMTVDEVLERVERDRIFYRRGGGGLTLSGGEILMQPKFAERILRGAWDRFTHTAIETCAFGNWQDLRSILRYTNLAFIDIKHMDTETHKRLTGRSNDRILNNLRRAAAFCLDHKREMIVRLVVVPGVNDSQVNLERMASFLRELPGEWELNLLPYHMYGVAKYDWLGAKYELMDVAPPSRERLTRLAGFFKSFNISTSVGGGEIKSDRTGTSQR